MGGRTLKPRPVKFPQMYKLLDYFESYANIAKLCGVTTQAVWKWKRVPIDNGKEVNPCLVIEKETKGVISRHYLRPDVYGRRKELSP